MRRRTRRNTTCRVLPHQGSSERGVRVTGCEHDAPVKGGARQLSVIDHLYIPAMVLGPATLLYGDGANGP